MNGTASNTTGVNPYRTSLISATQQIAWVFLGLTLVTVFLEFSGLDHWLPSIVFDQKRGRFPLSGNSFLKTFDDYALYPAVAMIVGYVVGGMIACLRNRNLSSLRGGLLMVVILAVGPGLLVNGTKRISGRPRPIQVDSYGGQYAHHPIWRQGPELYHCRSFPSGHASMRFYLMAPMFLCVASGSRKKRLGFLFAGLLWGSVIGLSRFVQGSHYLTDIMWSGGLVYMTGVFWQALILTDHRVSVEEHAESIADATKLAA